MDKKEISDYLGKAHQAWRIDQNEAYIISGCWVLAKYVSNYVRNEQLLGEISKAIEFYSTHLKGEQNKYERRKINILIKYIGRKTKKRYKHE